jgi:hypothetical protein
MEFVSKLKLDMERLEREYEAKGTVSWSTFKTDPATHQKKVIELTASDFSEGTLRIKFPCKLKLTGNVQFNPNRGSFLPDGKVDPARTLDWFPSRSVASNLDATFGYFTGDVAQAYGIGFFAAIAIEAEGVVVDLNSYTIAQHPEFSVMQQFFSCIELGDQPFPTNSGPFNFGSDLRRAKKVWIKNGILGYSSHQNLHANDSQEILVTGVTMKDSTVAGVSMNGSRKVALVDCEFKGHRTDVKVRGAFNEIRLDSKLIRGYIALKQSLEPSYEPSAELTASLEAAELAVEKVLNDVLLHGAIRAHDPLDTTTLSAADVEVLKNMTGLSDAISYGFVLNAGDNATGKFLETRDLKGNEASEIAVIRCNIEACTAAPIEVLALSPAIVATQEVEAGGEVLYDVNAQQRGATGAVFDFLRAFNYEGEASPSNAAYGAWKGNVVADIQCEIAALQNLETVASLKAMLGQINVDPYFIEAKRGLHSYKLLAIGTAEPAVAEEGDKVYLLIDAEEAATPELPFGPIAQRDIDGDSVADDLEYVVLAQGDIQHHVLKGNLGMRAEGISDLSIEHLTIAGVDNQGPMGYGYTATHGEMGYIGDTDGGHGGQGAMAGFFGNHTRGLSIAGCAGVKIKDLKISNIKSKTGPAIALDMKGESSDMKLEQVEVKTVTSGYGLGATAKVQIKAMKKYPNWQPTSTGIRADESVSYTEIKGLKVSGLTQPSESPKALMVESASVKVS